MWKACLTKTIPKIALPSLLSTTTILQSCRSRHLGHAAIFFTSPYQDHMRPGIEAYGSHLATLLHLQISDCVPHHSWISAGVRSLQTATEPVLAGGSIVFDFGNERLWNSYKLLDSIVHHRQTEYVFLHRFAATANLFVPRELFTIYGPFDPRFLSGGDREFGQRLSAAGVRVSFVEDAVVLHPARGRFMDLLRKNLRGAGGDKTFLSLSGTFRPLDLFKVQFNNFLHRQLLFQIGPTH